MLLKTKILAAVGMCIALCFSLWLSIHNHKPASRNAHRITKTTVVTTDFWRMRDFFFERQREFTPDNIVPRLTEEARRFRRFDSGRFAGCVAGKNTAAKVDLDLAFGTQNGVTGTPTLFINGQRVETVAAPEQLRTLIRETAASR